MTRPSTPTPTVTPDAGGPGEGAGNGDGRLREAAATWVRSAEPEEAAKDARA